MIRQFRAHSGNSVLRRHPRGAGAEHPGNLPFVLGHVAEIEDARRYLAARPPVMPDPPEDPREYLHLLAVEAWRALASGQPAPGVDPITLDQGIRAACGGGDPIDDLCEGWLEAAREHTASRSTATPCWPPSSPSSPRRSGPA